MKPWSSFLRAVVLSLLERHEPGDLLRHGPKRCRHLGDLRVCRPGLVLEHHDVPNRLRASAGRMVVAPRRTAPITITANKIFMRRSRSAATRLVG